MLFATVVATVASASFGVAVICLVRAPGGLTMRQLPERLRNIFNRSSEMFQMVLFLALGAISLRVRRDQFQARPLPASRRCFMPQGHIEGAFKGATGQGVQGARVQPVVAAARRPQPQPSPREAGSATGFPAASLLRVSARSQSRNARASGFSPEPGAIARK